MDASGKAQLYETLSQDEKHDDHCTAGHRRCHNGRLRQTMISVLLTTASVVGLLALGCFASMLFFGGEDDLPGLMRRQAAGDSTSSGNSFTDNKYYLIVIFVGLVVVIILGVMLSAWCCKGAFQNPLCCPCYLCACCGGLACLECIGCGLCAEGLDEVA